MKFSPTPLAGAYLVELDQIEDERGFFARSFCADEFLALGLVPPIAQCNLSHNLRRGTLRGLHLQVAPHQEAKLVRCTRGAVFDAIVDLRQGSETFCRSFHVELTAANRASLFVPRGFAHGYQTLEDDTEVFYQVSTAFHPASGRSFRYDDPAFGIAWPVQDAILSKKDAECPLFSGVAP